MIPSRAGGENGIANQQGTEQEEGIDDGNKVKGEGWREM